MDTIRKAEARMVCIQLQKAGLKPNLLSTCGRNFQLIVSNAFEMFTLRNRFPPKYLLRRWFIASEAIHMQPLMHMPLMNHLCLVKTKVGMKVASQSATIFVLILNLKLAKLIGIIYP